MLVFIPSSLFLFFSNDIMNQQELLTQREQLMWDIDGIVEEWVCNIVPDINEDNMEDLIKTLCDSVCKNFPTK
tara:strand:- start:401 stop:619 length:219 start_codon:yes stop_codon:yes gene_type:complete